MHVKIDPNDPNRLYANWLRRRMDFALAGAVPIVVECIDLALPARCYQTWRPGAEANNIRNCDSPARRQKRLTKAN